jgi:hypothetical protein
MHACYWYLGMNVGPCGRMHAAASLAVPRCDLDGSGRGLASSSLIAVQGSTIIMLAAAGKIKIHP